MLNRSSSVICPPNPNREAATESDRGTVSGTSDQRLIKLMKSIYQADQQVKYLHLQAEVDSLLQQLQILQKQRLATAQSDANN
ncbi:MAG: hypothetical protein RID09_11670 [Coleofasciculus sp. G1-WW12-02]|uniref:hypothetical protein n=1 Tax=unclassified Coleofasciculus TaxID=2692782 RepID=UPI0032F50E6F